MSRQSRREFIGHVGAVAVGVLAVPWLSACGDEGSGVEANEEWEALAAEAEGSMIYDASTPWSDGSQKAGTHVPKLEIDSFHGKSANVTVSHEVGPDHYISLIYVRDQNGIIVGLVEIPAPTSTSSQVFKQIPLPDSTTSVTAFSHCNLHDVWKSETVAI